MVGAGGCLTGQQKFFFRGNSAVWALEQLRLLLRPNWSRVSARFGCELWGSEQAKP